MKNFEEYFNEKLNENIKEKDFDRVEFYKEYYKNLSPSEFKVTKEDNIIKITIKK